MKLKEARNIGIKYCHSSNRNFCCISHDNSNGFYITGDTDHHTVFLVNKNGSLDAYQDTKYAVDFHKELKRKKNNRRTTGKKKMVDMVNHDFEEEV